MNGVSQGFNFGDTNAYLLKVRACPKQVLLSSYLKFIRNKCLDMKCFLKGLFWNYCSLSHHSSLKYSNPSDPGEKCKIR